MRAALRRQLIKPAFMLEGRALHAAAVGLAWPIEMVMSAGQRDLPVAPPIFILGPQRSGTTLFYKCFMQHQQVCMIDQAADYFPSRYLCASTLFHAIGADTATDFLERYDVRKDLWIRTWKNNGYGYTEGNRVWNKLGAYGTWKSDGHRRWARRFFPSLVQKIQRRSGKPVFLNKCPGNALRIAQLSELFPGARFIHLERDPRGVVNSIVNIHRSLGVSAWGPMPVPSRDLAGLTEYEAVARQWVAITDAIAAGLAQVPAARNQSVRYEDFLADPHGTLDRLARFFGLDAFASTVAMELRMDRKAGWRVEVPADEVARIERIIVGAGHAGSLASGAGL